MRSIEALLDLNPEILTDYHTIRKLPDGRLIGIHRLMFHWTVHVDIDAMGYSDRWCFQELADAQHMLRTWSGQGDPDSRWHKHPSTRRRRDPDTGEIWHESEDSDRFLKIGRFALKNAST